MTYSHFNPLSKSCSWYSKDNIQVLTVYFTNLKKGGKKSVHILGCQSHRFITWRYVLIVLKPMLFVSIYIFVYICGKFEVNLIISTLGLYFWKQKFEWTAKTKNGWISTIVLANSSRQLSHVSGHFLSVADYCLAVKSYKNEI